MNREEFDARLKENKQFEDEQEHMEYMLPVIQFFVAELSPPYYIQNNHGTFWLKDVEVISGNYELMKYAFAMIKLSLK